MLRYLYSLAIAFPSLISADFVPWHNTTSTSNSSSLPANSRRQHSSTSSTTSSTADGHITADYVASGLGLTRNSSASSVSSSTVDVSQRFVFSPTSLRTTAVSQTHSGIGISTTAGISGSTIADHSRSDIASMIVASNATEGSTSRSSSSSPAQSSLAYDSSTTVVRNATELIASSYISIFPVQSSLAHNSSNTHSVAASGYAYSTYQYPPEPSAGILVQSNSTRYAASGTGTSTTPSASSGFYSTHNTSGFYGITAGTGTGAPFPRLTDNFTNSTGADPCWTSWIDCWSVSSYDDLNWLTPGDVVISTPWVRGPSYNVTDEYVDDCAEIEKNKSRIDHVEGSSHEGSTVNDAYHPKAHEDDSEKV